MGQKLHKVDRKVEAPQWAFKVFPLDASYKVRTDTTNDFQDFDPDQNWQIERHYQDCNSRIKSYGDLHEIIGDLN